MTGRRPIFHIGSNKAGSTTLQKALFSRHSEILNLSKPNMRPRLEDSMAGLLDSVDSRLNSEQQADVSHHAEIWNQTVREGDADGRVPLYSRENLIRHYYYDGSDPERLPRKIVEMAGPVRVVLVVRNQIDLVKSLYIHKSSVSNYLPIEEWLASNAGERAFGYRFHRIADAWAGIIGERNVGVFLFEELAVNPEAFAHRLCAFLGVDPAEGVRLVEGQHENKRKSGRTLAYVQLRSAVLPDVSFGRVLPTGVRRRWRDWLEGGGREGFDLSDTCRSQLEEHYRSDNRDLSARFDLPLQRHGYPF